ncbi:uridylate kinase-like [Protopterus annectens]|uniref:uridylate kinase-like n=1 Tax=Protopterus annectens TaxID=7888 RepID=UPI001CFAC49F|nr:uridylate kinase-like [Protopterus annectens]
MVLLEKLVNHLDTHRDFLITGFPQNIDQAMEFDKQAVCPTHVIHINCSTGTRMTRLLIRKELQQSYMKDEASLKKRMYDYFKTIDSIINYYRISSHVKEINGEKELERVFKKCCKTLTSVLKCRC